MRLSERLSRLRWMAIPFAAYLVITLGLPLANGAAARRDFGHHAGWVMVGCAVVLALAVLGGAARDGLRHGLSRGGRS